MLLRQWCLWILRNRAFTVHYLRSYRRMWRAQRRNPNLRFAGPAFIGPNVIFEVDELARLEVEPYVHFGEGARVRAHEGTLRIGTKSIVGIGTTINCWIDISIGSSCLIGDNVYICDFDHRTESLEAPIKDQGIVKTPTSIGDDVWVGTKVVITRGTQIGPHSVVAAGAVTRGSYPPKCIIGGVPARVLRERIHITPNYDDDD